MDAEARKLELEQMKAEIAEALTAELDPELEEILQKELELQEKILARRGDKTWEQLSHLRFISELKDGVDYKKMYLTMFNAATRALDQMRELNFGKARDILEDAQIETEEAYIKKEQDEDGPVPEEKAES